MRRRGFVRAVLAHVEATGDTTAPWREVEGFADAFADDADLLRELHHEWVRHLVARLHQGRVVTSRTPANVRDLYDEVRAAHPSLRRLLDAHAGDAALRSATAQEHALLARIAGLAPEVAAASDDPDRAAAAGRALLLQRIPMQRQATR